MVDWIVHIKMLKFTTDFTVVRHKVASRNVAAGQAMTHFIYSGTTITQLLNRRLLFFTFKKISKHLGLCILHTHNNWSQLTYYATIV